MELQDDLARLYLLAFSKTSHGLDTHERNTVGQRLLLPTSRADATTTTTTVPKADSTTDSILYAAAAAAAAETAAAVEASEAAHAAASEDISAAIADDVGSQLEHVDRFMRQHTYRELELFRSMDKNRDGRIDKDEVTTPLTQLPCRTQSTI